MNTQKIEKKIRRSTIRFVKICDNFRPMFSVHNHMHLPVCVMSELNCFVSAIGQPFQIRFQEPFLLK